MDSLLAFVIPLKSARTARCWSTTLGLYRDCLRALSRQTGTGFMVVTVCHERPDAVVPLPRHVVRSVSHAPPRLGEKSLEDKWLKVARGIREARACGATHVMVVDADDLVSRRLSDWVAAHPDENGWILREGYHYRHRDGRLRRWRNFDRFCGTTAILRLDRLLEVAGELRPDRLEALFHHRVVARRMAERGYPLTTLPFPGSVYVFAKRENYSYSRRYYWLWGWKRWLEARPRSVTLTPERIAEFSLPDPFRTSTRPSRWSREGRRESGGGAPASSPSR